MEEVIHNISLAMMNKGCKPIVFAPYVRGKNNTLDFPYTVLRYSRPSSKRYGLYQLVLPLLWLHRKHRFDILHCHGAYPPGYVGALFYKITGVPFIITPHGGDIEKDSQGLIINSKVTNRIKKTLSKALAVTAISPDIKRRVLELGASSEKIQDIKNGIFLNHFKTDRISNKQLPGEAPYISYLGHLRWEKGVDILIKAFSKIQKNYPDLRLKIAGGGVEQKNLMAIANKLDCGESIDFLGVIYGDKKKEFLMKSLFFVCPSRIEGFGIVNLEALASGVPAVGTRVGGIPDIIRDGENGFLVEPEDPDQLAEKIDLLLKDESLRQNLAKNAFNSVAEYDWNNIIDNYIDLYKRILTS